MIVLDDRVFARHRTPACWHKMASHDSEIWWNSCAEIQSDETAGADVSGIENVAVRLQLGDPHLVCGPCVPHVNSSAPPLPGCAALCLTHSLDCVRDCVVKQLCILQPAPDDQYDRWTKITRLACVAPAPQRRHISRAIPAPYLTSRAALQLFNLSFDPNSPQNHQTHTIHSR
jgi:hypothetical protein